MEDFGTDETLTPDEFTDFVNEDIFGLDPDDEDDQDDLFDNDDLADIYGEICDDGDGQITVEEFKVWLHD